MEARGGQWCNGRMVRDAAYQSDLDYDIDNNIPLRYDNASRVIEMRSGAVRVRASAANTDWSKLFRELINHNWLNDAHILFTVALYNIAGTFVKPRAEIK